MSLIERTLPVFQRQDSFFENVFAGMTTEENAFEEDVARMRERMFHLVPFDDKQDVAGLQMEVDRPVIEEKGQSKLHLKFDVSKFKPDEVKVKVVGGHVLQVNAEHHEKDKGKEVHRFFSRQFSLPNGVDAQSVTADVTNDGVLTIEGPAPPLSPKEKLIPIKYDK